MLQCDNGSAHRDNRSFSSPDVTGVSVHRATQLFPDDDAWNTSLADRAVGAGGGGEEKKGARPQDDNDRVEENHQNGKKRSACLRSRI